MDVSWGTNMRKLWIMGQGYNRSSIVMKSIVAVVDTFAVEVGVGVGAGSQGQGRVGSIQVGRFPRGLVAQSRYLLARRHVPRNKPANRQTRPPEHSAPTRARARNRQR